MIDTFFMNFNKNFEFLNKKFCKLQKIKNKNREFDLCQC